MKKLKGLPLTIYLNRLHGPKQQKERLAKVTFTKGGAPDIVYAVGGFAIELEW
jgi:hypothetical protein